MVSRILFEPIVQPGAEVANSVGLASDKAIFVQSFF
jgi:hypothetical protein